MLCGRLALRHLLHGLFVDVGKGDLLCGIGQGLQEVQEYLELLPVVIGICILLSPYQNFISNLDVVLQPGIKGLNARCRWEGFNELYGVQNRFILAFVP